jgi:hypothetical protein
MEVYILTEVTYDYFRFTKILGVFDSAENTTEFVLSIENKYYKNGLPIYDLSDKTINYDALLDTLRKKETAHWEITKYELNVGEFPDDSDWTNKE